MWMNRPLVFGEILFDVFEDGSEVLGGAPLNVARHLQGWGLNPLMISRVGADVRGDKIMRSLCSVGMDTIAIQVDPDHPTGVVGVTLEQGLPRYEIKPGAAWDFIDWGVLERSLGPETEAGLVCAGTLALRSEVSRAAFDRLCRNRSRDLLLDLNLRPPWWTPELVAAQIERARWLKLNDEELETVTGRGRRSSDEFTEEACETCRELDIDLLAVTFGSAGAVLATREATHFSPSHRNTPLVDTVGAGDGFTAAVIRGIMQNQAMPEMLNSAVAFAGRICGIRGATPAEPSFYRSSG